MTEKINGVIEWLDWPSGSILGLFTLLMILTSTALVILKIKNPTNPYEIPTSVIDIYKFVVGAFAGSKTISTMWGKFVPQTPPVTNQGASSSSAIGNNS